MSDKYYPFDPDLTVMPTDEPRFSEIPDETASAPKKKLRGFISAFLIPALIWAVIDVCGELFFDAVSEQNAQNKLENHYAQQKEFVPGVLTEDSYVSEYLNLEFQTNEHWVMFSGEELEDYADSWEELMLGSYSPVLKDNGLSQELVDTIIENSYVSFEMGANYYDDDGYYAGETYIVVTNLFSIAELSHDEMDQILTESVSSNEGTVVSTVEFAGMECDVYTIPVSSDGITAHLSNIFLFKDGILCWVRCDYIDGCEEVFESFLEQFTAVS